MERAESHVSVAIRDTHHTRLKKKIETKEASISVIGLGYVGLPLATGFAQAGFHVTGIDLDERKVDAINHGISYISDVSSDQVHELTQKERLQATLDQGQLSNADVIFICVPTPFTKTKDPDLSYIESAVDMIRQHLREGQLIVLESTTFPGTTEEIVQPRLEKTGMQVGKEFFLSFSPERVDPGNKDFNAHNTPKVVGGITSRCLDLAGALYSGVIDEQFVHLVSSTKVAEMTKLLENTFRSVNIALVNELALLCHRMGIDVWEVIDAAATKPFGYMPFYPGPGVGGHCIPIDPYYLSWKAKEYEFDTKFIQLAADINNQMPLEVVYRISDALNERKRAINGAKILAIGASFKKDISDSRYSPAIRVMDLLLSREANLDYYDPYVNRIDFSKHEDVKFSKHIVLTSIDLDYERLEEYDCVVILVDHSQLNYAQLAKRAKLIIDTRNVLKDVSERDNIIKL